jgi:hypothetical protein
MGRNKPSRRSVRLHCGHLRPFSDGLSAHSGEYGHEEGELGALAPPAASNRSRPCRRPKRPSPVGTSLYDAEREMRDPSSLDHPSALQLDRLSA